MSWSRRSEDNTLRVTCEWQCHEWYNKYGCDFFQQIELLVACKTALVHIHVLAIAILTGWYIWPLARDPLLCFLRRARVAQWVRQLDYLITHTSLSPIRRGFAPGCVNYKKGALDSQTQVIKFTSCLPMVGGSLRVLRLLPPLKMVAMIQLKYCWKWR